MHPSRLIQFQAEPISRRDLESLKRAPDLLRAPETTKSGRRIFFINDVGSFWQEPAGQSQ